MQVSLPDLHVTALRTCTIAIRNTSRTVDIVAWAWDFWGGRTPIHQSIVTKNRFPFLVAMIKATSHYLCNKPRGREEGEDQSIQICMGREGYLSVCYILTRHVVCYAHAYPLHTQTLSVTYANVTHTLRALPRYMIHTYTLQTAYTSHTVFTKLRCFDGT